MRGGLGRLLAGLPPGMRQLVRFAIAGGLGTVTNLGLFFVLVDLGDLPPLFGMLLGFGVAASQNYVLNELWTFATGSGGGLSRRRYAKFLVASLAGLAVNAVVLFALLAAFDFPFAVIPQAAGIAAGMLFNFAASRWFIFRRGDDATNDQISE
jgi:putative flippase GtrA